MISDEEKCRRNARALWVPYLAFSAMGFLSMVMMVVRMDFGWRAIAGTLCMAAFSAIAYRKIRYWRNAAAVLRADARDQPNT